MPYFGIFELEFQNTIVISEISNPEFLKNESLTHTVNFGIGSTFSRGLESGFSKSRGLGPGPLYKVSLRRVIIFRKRKRKEAFFQAEKGIP